LASRAPYRISRLVDYLIRLIELIGLVGLIVVINLDDIPRDFALQMRWKPNGLFENSVCNGKYQAFLISK